jgi:hypothetical protein
MPAPDHAALWELASRTVYTACNINLGPKGEVAMANFDVTFGGPLSLTPCLRVFLEDPVGYTPEQPEMEVGAMEFGIMLALLSSNGHTFPIEIYTHLGAQPLTVDHRSYYALAKRWHQVHKDLDGHTFQPCRWEVSHAGPLRRAALTHFRQHFGEPDFYRTIVVKEHTLEFAYAIRRDQGLIIQQTLNHGLWRWPSGIGRHEGCELLLAWEAPAGKLEREFGRIEYFQDLVTQFLLENKHPSRNFSCGSANAPLMGNQSDLCGIMLAAPRFTSSPETLPPRIYGDTEVLAIVGLMRSEVRLAGKGGRRKDRLVNDLVSNPMARTVVAPWRRWRLAEAV